MKKAGSSCWDVFLSMAKRCLLSEDLSSAARFPPANPQPIFLASRVHVAVAGALARSTGPASRHGKASGGFRIRGDALSPDSCAFLPSAQLPPSRPRTSSLALGAGEWGPGLGPAGDCFSCLATRELVNAASSLSWKISRTVRLGGEVRGLTESPRPDLGSAFV